MKHPDFICIGVQKSGTTWLFRELAGHPQVKMPGMKELRFFRTSNWRTPVRGSGISPLRHLLTPWSWPFAARYHTYCRHFAGCEGYVTGDISPGYIISEEAAQRIRRYVPNPKLLVILRNPVDRAFSQWRMMNAARTNKIAQCFLDAFHRDVELTRSQGHYADYLQAYMRYFTLNKDLRVFLYDDLSNDAQSFMDSVHQYLGLDEFASPTVMTRQQSASQGDGLKITPAERRQAQEYYRTHVESLEKLLQRPLNWLRA